MAAQELRWLTYLLTDLGEQHRSPPVLYVDNKAMLALCREHRLEHRTKHIALRYFLARKLQQCGQLRLAYVASQANTADIFTKALAPGDHQRFCTLLACFALLDWSYGTIERFKARWVVRGYDQRHGINFDQTFAPVSRHTSVRILLAIAAPRHLLLRQIDVKNAFLYALKDAVIYVEQPHTYGEGDSRVCQLRKSLYGIKQAPRLWQHYLHLILLEIGFKQLPHDPRVYRQDFCGKYILPTVYVGDLLYTGSSNELLELFKKNLARSVDITLNHDVKQFLGRNISYAP
ncbi:unnamed protein product [Closterium sp. NIES-53]